MTDGKITEQELSTELQNQITGKAIAMAIVFG